MGAVLDLNVVSEAYIDALLFIFLSEDVRLTSIAAFLLCILPFLFAPNKALTSVLREWARAFAVWTVRLGGLPVAASWVIGANLFRERGGIGGKIMIGFCVPSLLG